MNTVRTMLVSLSLIATAALSAPGDTLFQYPADDLAGWTVVSSGGDASIGGETAQAGQSLRLRWGPVTATSPTINAQVAAAELSLWIRRGADTFSENPEQNEDLVLEYLTAGGAWASLATYSGNGTPGEIFTPTFSLPADGLHNSLQLRLSLLAGSGQDWDYWHIDDIEITETGPGPGLGIGTCETFESGLNGWQINAGSGAAGVSNATANSPTSSLFTRSGDVTVTSPTIDLTGASPVNLSVWVQRGDDNFSEDPDPGEDLVIEYRDANGNWQALETFSGNGRRGQIFQPSYSLPNPAEHAAFQVRFRQLDGDPDSDYWHIDDVCLGTPLIAAYEFEAGAWTGASSEVVDRSGNGLHATAFGGATTDGVDPAIAGNPGTCRYAEMDGSNDYLQVDDDPKLDLPNTLTIATWINMQTLPSGGGLHTIVSKDWNYEYHINSSGQVYWWWNDSNGNTRTITSNQSIGLNTWHHIAITYSPNDQRIYLDGNQIASANFPGNLRLNDVPLFIGTDWNFISRAFDGYIDEVRVFGSALDQATVQEIMAETHPCATVGAEFRINHDNNGIHCLAETITVDVVDAVAGTPLTSYSNAVTLDTQTGSGTWSLISGGGVFNDAIGDDGVASYDWPLGETQAVFQLRYRQGTPAMDIDVFQSDDNSVRDDDAEGQMTFTASGFTLTATTLANPPALPVVPFAANQTAAVGFPVHIAAFGQTANDPVCGIIESYTGVKPLQFWQTYANPSSGTRTLNVDGSAIASGEASAVAQNVIFTNGQAAITVSYKDVGAVALAVKDETSGNPELPQGIRGATADFVVRPARYEITDIRDASGAVNNPAATTATGPVFLAAGAPFRMTVTALDADGDPVPNYGRETPPETVRLTTQLIAPAGGSAPNVTAGTGFGAFAGGSASGFDFVWPEVGIMNIVPGVGDSDYLGSGDVTGDASVNVGRFIPDHFTISQNIPIFNSGCDAGGFTYLGQSFDYLTTPVITTTARALGGTTTVNYSGAFFKLASTTLQNRQYQTSQGTLDVSGLPPASADPTVIETAPGVATLTFDAGTGLRFDRGTPSEPFDAIIALSIDVLDADGVAGNANPVVFGDPLGIAFAGGASQRYGRVRIGTGVGSELLNLPIAMMAEYYVSAALGFSVNANDTCTNNVSLGFTNFTDNLANGETCVLDAGAPGLSGIGCAAPSATPFRLPPQNVNFGLTLAAPGVGNSGGVTITSSVPAWLRFDWNVALPGDENPSGHATFGLYPGEGRAHLSTRIVLAHQSVEI